MIIYVLSIFFLILHGRKNGLNVHPQLCQYAISGEACEHSGTPLSIDCGEKVISIVHAAYGVYSNDNTCGVSYGGDCLSTTSLEVL